MDISGARVADGSAYYIAEAGVNHNGDLEIGRKLIDIATDAGADAVKFQTFSAERLTTREVEKATYQRDGTGESQYEMLERYELDEREHGVLQEHCQERGITFLSTPFDSESADLLDRLDVPAVKISSTDLTDHPLLRHVAGFGRPMVVSTGASTMEEVRAAYEVIRTVDSELDVAFLHCTSSYPARLEDVNLRAMRTMIEQLAAPIGYSDHTTHVETPGFAVAAGAQIVEKHFTVDRDLPGPDHEASLEPDELARSVSLARRAATALGSREKSPVGAEAENRYLSRKSLHAKTFISAGERFTRTNVTIKRPAEGMEPAALDSVIGSRARRDVETDEPITEDVIDDR